MTTRRMAPHGPRLRVISWSGTLPSVEAPTERTDRLPLQPPPSRRPTGWCNDVTAMRRLLDGLSAL